MSFLKRYFGNTIGEKLIFLFLFIIFFSPFSAVFNTYEWVSLEITYPFPFDSLRECGPGLNPVINPLTLISITIGFFFFTVSFFFQFIFQQFRFRLSLVSRIVLFIILPAFVSIFLIIPTARTSMFAPFFRPHPIMLSLDYITFSVGGILERLVWTVLFSLVKLITYMIPFLICLLFWQKIFGLKLNFPQTSFTFLKSLFIFYIGIPMEVFDRMSNSFFTGDVVYSVLIVVWLIILTKNLYPAYQNSRKTLLRAIAYSLITLTIIYFLGTGIYMFNLLARQRALILETITFHRFFLLLPVASIFSWVWYQLIPTEKG